VERNQKKEEAFHFIVFKSAYCKHVVRKRGNMKNILTIALVLLWFCCGRAHAEVRYFPLNESQEITGKIVRINPDNLTMTVKTYRDPNQTSYEENVFTASLDTQVTINQTPAKFSDLATGDLVTIKYYIQSANPKNPYEIIARRQGNSP
jgi:hypothetical protein